MPRSSSLPFDVFDLQAVRTGSEVFATSATYSSHVPNQILCAHGRNAANFGIFAEGLALSLLKKNANDEKRSISPCRSLV
jgi:hypothetical protein